MKELGSNIMKKPTTQTIKKLFALSSNICAFPGCRKPLVDLVTMKVLGHICHIKGENKGSARWDQNQTEDERRAFENLILMCPPHHAMIDTDEAQYSVDYLTRLKSEHESQTVRVEPLSKKLTYQFLSTIKVQNKYIKNDVKIGTVRGDFIQGNKITNIKIGKLDDLDNS